MKITPEIIAELEHWLHANGRTKADMARSLGLTKQAVGLWFKPQAKLIKPKHWVRLVQLVPRLRGANTRQAPAVVVAPPSLDCPLADCPGKGVPHSPATQMLLEAWAAIDMDARLDLLKEANRLAVAAARRGRN
jgi:hypothetical protein